MTNKYVIITLALVISIGTAAFALNYMNKNKNVKPAEVTPTQTLTPTSAAAVTPATADNKFVFGKVNNGDKAGQMAIKSIKTEEGYITITFDGKVEISGDYVSDYSGMSGQYITLNLDEESKAKIPYEQSQETFDVVLDPEYQNNKELISAFGKTGTKGKFKIEIDSYYVTNWIEAIPRVARISKVIEVTPQK